MKIKIFTFLIFIFGLSNANDFCINNNFSLKKIPEFKYTFEKGSIFLINNRGEIAFIIKQEPEGVKEPYCKILQHSKIIRNTNFKFVPVECLGGEEEGFTYMLNNNKEIFLVSFFRYKSIEKIQKILPILIQSKCDSTVIKRYTIE